MTSPTLTRLAVAGATGVLALTALGGPALGASHREAPLISKDRSADNTDVYAFVSPDKPNTVTLIANYDPGQRPDDGPNFFPFDDDVHYFLKVDNTGDGVEDITILFDFDSRLANPDSFLGSGYGPIEDLSDPQGAPFAPANFTQTYRVTMNDEVLGTGLAVPPPSVGPRTTPEYRSYVADTIHEVGDNVTVFAGSRDDPFFLDAGAIFDLGGLRPFNEAHLIPLGQKDAWNAGQPADDAQYLDRYLNPELAAVINTIYPSLPDARTTDRTDLVLILGQGVPTLNATNTGDTLYDMLRLNMGVPATDKPDRMGVLGGDLAGFPNGRRLTDDIVDIELRAIADGYGKFLEDNFQLPNLDPNNTVGDGCNANDAPLLDKFPYLATPWSGYRGGVLRNTPCANLDRGGNDNGDA